MTCLETLKNGAITLKKLFNPSKRDFDRKHHTEFHSHIKTNKQSKGDILLFSTILSLVLFGLLMVYSSSYIFAQERTGDGFAFIKKQIVFAILGFSGFYAVSRLNYEILENASRKLLIFISILLGVVLIPGVGVKVGGAQRWLSLGFFNFQPGELAKFILIIFVSAYIVKKSDQLRTYRFSFFSIWINLAPALLFLLLQPDFGSFAITFLVVLALMFLGGIPIKNVIGLTISAIVLMTGLILSSHYRQVRFLAFLDPWQDPSGRGFQILQSLVGISNGRLTGVGLGNGKEKLFYLPEAHNDFIFAVIGEELGFVGVFLLVVAFSFFVYRGFKIAWRCLNEKKDTFGFLLASGITLMIGTQAFINMLVVMGLLPTKGLSLPFISYGGSALMVNLFFVGILYGISRRLKGAH